MKKEKVVGGGWRYCCHADCQEDATFEIHTVGTLADGREVFPGPDIFADQTHACVAHVGVLLGYQPEAPRPEEIFWKVFPIQKVK